MEEGICVRVKMTQAIYAAIASVAYKRRKNKKRKRHFQRIGDKNGEQKIELYAEEIGVFYRRNRYSASKFREFSRRFTDYLANGENSGARATCQQARRMPITGSNRIRTRMAQWSRTNFKRKSDDAPKPAFNSLKSAEAKNCSLCLIISTMIKYIRFMLCYAILPVTPVFYYLSKTINPLAAWIIVNLLFGTLIYFYKK